MSDDLNKKIKQIADALNQEDMPGNNDFSLLMPSVNKFTISHLYL
jgi:hypothetical protein